MSTTGPVKPSSRRVAAALPPAMPPPMITIGFPVVRSVTKSSVPAGGPPPTSPTGRNPASPVARAAVTQPTAIALVRLGQEGLDVGGEFGVMLEQEPVRGVGVDLHRGLRDHAGE